MKYIILIIVSLALNGCVTTGSSSVSSEQELKKSPCACNDYQIFDGKVYFMEAANA